jgi:hypothetical protein
MPVTKVAMLKVIHMTENVYTKFQCEELLPIFQDYAKRREVLIQDEVKKKQELYEKAQKELQSKAYQSTKSFTGNWNSQASLKHSNGYGLVENDCSSIDYNPGAMSRSNVQANKKRPYGANNFSSRSKKGKWGGGGTDSPNTSGFKKKTPFKKPFKKYNFKSKKS